MVGGNVIDDLPWQHTEEHYLAAMRKLASFAFNYTGEDVTGTAEQSREVLDAWLSSKGRIADGYCHMPNGAVATVEMDSVSAQRGGLHELVFTEPTPDGRFRTKVVIGHDEERLVVGITLSAIADRMGPTFMEVRGPKLIRDLIDLGVTWRFGSTPLGRTPVHLKGEDGGRQFIAMVLDSTRSLPVVAIAEEAHGALLHPDLCSRMAGDLAGIATVVHLNEDASWHVTKQRGKEWSCYAGAVRLYWPGVHDKDDPFRHPLWSPWKLMQDARDTEHASIRLRAQLRRMIFSQAVFFITEPPLFSDIRSAARQEERAKLLKKASSVEEYEELLEEADRANGVLETERDELRKRVEDLEAQLEQYKVIVEHAGREQEGVEPNVEQIPTTPEDAVLIAADRFCDELIFGKDAYEEVSKLAHNAGPPEKILLHFEALAALTRERRKGSIGKSAVQWLVDKGVSASIESETIRNSTKEQQIRTWEDGTGGYRAFDEHTKPSNQTSPDRCVRIYFQYDPDTGKTIIGYVGGKFGL